MYSRLVGSAALFVILIGFDSTAVAQPPTPDAAQAPQLAPPRPENQATAEPEVLEGGPLHEAFAHPLALEAKPIVINREPPEPIEELPPEERPAGDNVNWLPGYWLFDIERDDFVWVSGLWRNFPPGRTWVPGEWQQVEAGYQWMAGYWAESQIQQQALLPAPPVNLEQGPSSPAPGDNYLWTPGCWQWQGVSYAWQPGFWYVGQPDWVWIPNHYSYTPRGVVYVRGYWDYPLARRGILYAPVYWGAGFHARTNYIYRPRTLVNTGLLVANLFLDHRHGRYYYGRSWGIGRNVPSWLSPWGNNLYSHWGRHHGRSNLYDPLWSHFRWDGHGKHGHGKFNHQQLAAQKRTRIRTTKADDLFRTVDRLTTAERKSLKLQQNNTQDLAKFRKQAEKYRNFDRAKMIRDQRLTGKTDRALVQGKSQIAGNRNSTEQRVRTGRPDNAGQVLDDNKKKLADVRRARQNLPKPTTNRRPSTQLKSETQVRAGDSTRGSQNGDILSQLRQNARTRANGSSQRSIIDAQNRLGTNRLRTNQQGQSIQRPRSFSPALSNQQRPTTRGRTLYAPPSRSGFSGLSNNRGSSPPVGNQAQQSVRNQFLQRTAKPATSSNSLQLRTNRGRTPQNVRPSQGMRTNQSLRSSTSQPTARAMPSMRQTIQSRGNQVQRSRGNVGRNYRPPSQRRGKK